MGSVHVKPETGNPIAELLGAALAHALRMPEVIAALREAAAPAAPSAPAKATGLTKHEIADALGKSPSSIDRLDREPAAPFYYCGDSKRYDLETYRTWLASRGKKPTRAAKKVADVDISDIADAAGLIRQ